MISKKKIALTIVAGLLGFGLISCPVLMASEPFLGEIKLVGFSFAPRGYATCDGQLLSINQNTALFSLLGTTFGGDGRSTFALPDLRGRTAVHVGSGPGLTPITWGEKFGNNTHTLTSGQMPVHSHTAKLRGQSGNGTESSPAGHSLANDSREDQYSDQAPDVDMIDGSVTLGSAGGSNSFKIMQPSLGIYHVIATVGIYPSRD